MALEPHRTRERRGFVPGKQAMGTTVKSGAFAFKPKTTTHPTHSGLVSEAQCKEGPSYPEN